MRVTRKEIKKPTGEWVRYSLTELTPAQFEAILRGLKGVSFSEDKEAAELLKTLTSVQEG